MTVGITVRQHRRGWRVEDDAEIPLFGYVFTEVI